MKIKQKDLSFLNLYSISKDNSRLGDKLQIEVLGDKVRFCQKTDLGMLITEKEIEGTETFSLLVNLKLFIDLVNSVDKESEINITEAGVSLGKDNHYQIDNYTTLPFPNVENSLQMIESEKLNCVSLVISEIDKLNVVKQFVGQGTENAISVCRGVLMGTDKKTMAYTNTDLVGKTEESYFISESAVNLIKSETEIFFHEKFYFFKIGDTICIYNWYDYKLPDLFSENFKSKFNHTTHILVSKEELVKVLSRMKLFVTNNDNNRIFITLNPDHILIENRDFSKSFEKIQIKSFDEVLDSEVLVLDCLQLIKIVNCLKGSDIFIYANTYVNPQNGKKNPIRIEDENHILKFVCSRVKED